MLSSVCLHLLINPFYERRPLDGVHARHQLRNLSDVLLNQLLGAFVAFHIVSMVSSALFDYHYPFYAFIGISP